MQLTNREITHLFQHCSSAESAWTKNTELNTLHFAIMNLKDELLNDFSDINKYMSDVLSRHAELDENGNPKQVKKLIALNNANGKDEYEIVWKTSIDEYKKEELEYMNQKRDLGLRKYELSELLKCKPRTSDISSYAIIKYISL